MIRAWFILFLLPVLSLASQLTANRAFVNRVGPIVDDSIGPMQTVVTDLSTTPSTNTTTLWGTRNALRVWTGDQDHTLPWFELYTTTNGVAGPTVRLYYGQGRILSLAPGTTISLGTTNGRAVKVSQMTIPGTLPAPTGQTNTITVAKAGPPIWTPSAAQIVLPTGNNAFAVTSTNDFPLFVSEFDGAAWTPTRWYRLEANNAVTIQATYPQVALGNYDAYGLTVVTPLGSTVSSTVATMHLAFPVVTGTTRSCTTAAEFMQAVTNAVSGDEIVLQDGLYELPVNIVRLSFSNNVAHGYSGPEGITFRSASGNRTNVVLTGATTNSGGWFLYLTNVLSPICIRDMTFAFTNGSSNFVCLGGRYLCENVRWYGTAANVDLLSFAPQSASVCTFTSLWCQADSSGGDCFDGSSGGATNVSQHLICSIGTESYSAGAATSAQLATSHGALPFDIWGGHYRDVTLNIIAPDNAGTPMRCFFFESHTNATPKNGMQDIYLFGISHTGYKTGARLNQWCLFNRMEQTVNFTNTTFVGHNQLLTTDSGASGPLLAGNVFYGSVTGSRVGFDPGSDTGNYSLIGNSYMAVTTALNLVATNINVLLTNNACASNTTSLTLSTQQTNHFGADFNVFDPAVSANFKQTNSNVVGVNAAIDGRWFPTASGNCDGTGFAAFPWVGDSDPWGYVWVYKSGVWPRGARTIPAIVSGAFIYPDVW